MKKNEFATFITYVGMLAIIMLVGLLVIRPAAAEYNSQGGGMPFALLAILAIAVGILFNALLIEQGHLVGAKAGGYKIISWNVLGIKFEKNEKGKTKISLSSFQGLTGETKIVPTNVQENGLSGFISFPLLSYLGEVVLCVILIAIGKANAYWLYVSAIIVLAIGGVIYLYNYFPARLDVETDGYRMTVLNKPVNKLAYNEMLLANYNLEIGKKDAFIKQYDDVTDFTASLNLLKVYDYLSRNDFGAAITLLQKTLDTPNHVGSEKRQFANILKLTLVILTTKKEDGRTFYQTIDDSHRRYIEELTNSVSMRAYVLIQGVLEGDFEQTKFGLDKAKKLIKYCPSYASKEEIRLFNLSLDRIASLHPTWDMKPYVINPEEK